MGPIKGVWVSGVDSKFENVWCPMEIRLSVSGWSGVSSVGLTILSVGVDRHWFWFECQCPMEKMGQCWVSEIPPLWALKMGLSMRSISNVSCHTKIYIPVTFQPVHNIWNPHPIHSEKKGTKTVPLGCYCYKWYAFFQSGTLFSLIIMFMEERVPFIQLVPFFVKVAPF